jgi:hypothetical protein
MTNVSDSRQRSLVTFTSGAPFTASQSARLPALTGPGRGVPAPLACFTQAAPTQSSVLGSRLSNHHPASTARSPVLSFRGWG